MKKIIFSLCLFATIPALANLDSADAINVVPNAARVNASRACFSELDKMGCGHPKDDLSHFRTCMSEIYSTLDVNCQKIMKRLYGK